MKVHQKLLFAGTLTRYFVLSFVGIGMISHAELTLGNELEDSKLKREKAAEIVESRHSAFLVAVDSLRAKNPELGSFTLIDKPPTVSGLVPVTFAPFQHISVDLLMDDPIISRSIVNGDYTGLLTAFNIQVLSSNKELSWPIEATAQFKIEKFDDLRTLELHLLREGNQYIFKDKFRALDEIMSAVEELNRLNSESGPKPRMSLEYLIGFERTVAKATEISFPVGVPVTYSLRLGNVRLHSNAIWLGRPTEFTNIMPQVDFFR